MAEQNTPAPADMVEAVARIIDPVAWQQFDTSVRPYAENRGSKNEEFHWYSRTWAQGCRTAEDVKCWWSEKANAGLEATYVAHFRDSLVKAQAAITAMQAYMASDGVTQMDRDAADKAFDIAFRGDTDGIDCAMAELFAAHRRAATITSQPASVWDMGTAFTSGFEAGMERAMHLRDPKDCGYAPSIAEARAAYLAKAAPHPDPRDAEIERLREAIINTPETADFMAGVPLEALHQRERWGSDHDAGKSPFDWFWLIGYLAQKAADAAVRGDTEKALHHTISTAAALANWHAAISGASISMRPGIEPPAALAKSEGK